MNLNSSTYPEMIAWAAAERIKRMERARAAEQARKARRACRARQVQRSLVGWTRLGSRPSGPDHQTGSRCAH
jgi:hypothetical protein